MNNSLMNYLNKRLHPVDAYYQSAVTHPGPVICISREVGCGAVNFARILAVELDKHTFSHKWKVISKEILTNSANELNMDRDRLRSIIKEGDRGIFDDILSAFSEKRFKSDRKIGKTLQDLMRSIAIDGYCIIVGRAGHIFTHDIEKSLLIKLSGTFEWRIKQIMDKNHLNLREAMDFIERTEKERQNFRRYFAEFNKQEDEFDLTINISRIEVSHAIQLICSAAQWKGLLETNKSKVEVF